MPSKSTLKKQSFRFKPKFSKIIKKKGLAGQVRLDAFFPKETGLNQSTNTGMVSSVKPSFSILKSTKRKRVQSSLLDHGFKRKKDS